MVIIITEPKEYVELSVDDIEKQSPIYGGFYYFYDKYDEIIYVGKTKCFHKRFMSHRRKSYFFAHVSKIRAYHVSDEVERDIYETYFINAYRPQYNIAKKWDSAAETDYLEDIALIEEELAELESERDALMEELAELDVVDLDEKDDYYDDQMRLTIELGTNLRAAERIPEIDKEIKSVKSRLKYAKSLAF